ncbi:MAG: hypothetical protein ACNA8O_11460 [Cyanobacteriota bacterium]
MPHIDLLMAAELVVALLLVATMDSPSPRETAVEPPQEEPAPGRWSAETDLHAQRILRLERRQATTAAPTT